MTFLKEDWLIFPNYLYYGAKARTRKDVSGQVRSVTVSRAKFRSQWGKATEI